MTTTSQIANSNRNQGLYESFNIMGRNFQNFSHEEKMINEVKRHIIGYNTKLKTPIGTLCSVYADHTATGRPIALIERHVIEDIKPMLANSHTETSEMGKFSTSLLKYAEESILSSFNVSKRTHFAVPTAFGCTGALERLLKILNLEVDVFNGMAKNSHMKKEDNPDIPVVFLTPYEHHSNILPWVNAGCKVQVIESDAMGHLDFDKFFQQLESHKNYRKIIVSTSAASNVTSQHTNLEELNMLIKRFRKNLPKTTRFYWVVDAAAYSSHGRLDLKGNLSLCDAVCLSPHKNLGGAEATGVLIMRLAAYDLEKNPSFPGGGTVSVVIGITEDKIFYDTEPTHREMPGTPNAVGFYRAALTFQLQDWIGIDLIIKRERDNAQYFFSKIFELNKRWQSDRMLSNRMIDIVGDQDMSKRFGVFSFNIYGPGTMYMPDGKCCFHPHYVAKLLNDLFGIQARSGCACAGPFGVKLLKFTEKSSMEMAEKILEGKEALKPGWCRIDTNFVFQQYEIDYILKAIEIVAVQGEKLQEYYTQDSSGQWSIPFRLENKKYKFGMEGILHENTEENEFSLEERPKLLLEQLEKTKRIFEDPQLILYKVKSDELQNHYKRFKMARLNTEEEDNILNQSMINSEKGEALNPLGFKNSSSLKKNDYPPGNGFNSAQQIERRTSGLQNPNVEDYKNIIRSRNSSQESQNNGMNSSSKRPGKECEPTASNVSKFTLGSNIYQTAEVQNKKGKESCRGCKNWINDASPSLQQGQSFFHADCFKCWYCTKLLFDGHYLEDEEKISCLDCVLKVKCPVCKESLNENYVLVKKKGYHAECFRSAGKEGCVVKKSSLFTEFGYLVVSFLFFIILYNYFSNLIKPDSTVI